MTITEDKSAADSPKMQGTQMSRAVSKRSPSKRSLRIAAETKRAISITVLDSFKIHDPIDAETMHRFNQKSAEVADAA